MSTNDSNAPVLVVNCGSSSLKYAVVNTDASQPFSGLAENLGTPEARVIMKDTESNEKQTFELANADHKAAIELIFEKLGDIHPAAIGHRVVHGGEAFTEAALITDDVLDAIKKTSPLAPLHNPANLQGIAATKALFPDLPQVAVFDTAFHQSMPAKAFRYGLPTELYTEHGIRRYGFHGTSHAYVSSRADELVDTKDNGWLTAHLGNGCSTSAIYAGKSLDTSMGLTPLEGVVMGTRSGDIDPGIYTHLHRSLGMSVDDIDKMLNKKSGLLGLSNGLSNDMRTLDEAAAEGNADAKLAIDVFCYRVAKSLASLSCALPCFTGILFTGGIGENAVGIRAQIVTQLAHFGITFDAVKNSALSRGAEGSFHADDSRVQLWVVPTDEEGRIASETRALI